MEEKNKITPNPWVEEKKMIKFKRRYVSRWLTDD